MPRRNRFQGGQIKTEEEQTKPPMITKPSLVVPPERRLVRMEPSPMPIEIMVSSKVATASLPFKISRQ